MWYNVTERTWETSRLEAFTSGFVTESRAAKDSRISDTNWNFIDFDSTSFELVREFLWFFCHAAWLSF